jgi:hypothetical protein
LASVLTTESSILTRAPGKRSDFFSKWGAIAPEAASSRNSVSFAVKKEVVFLAIERAQTDGEDR